MMDIDEIDDEIAKRDRTLAEIEDAADKARIHLEEAKRYRNLLEGESNREERDILKDSLEDEMDGVRYVMNRL